MTHGAHWRSATVVPALVLPSPTTHVLHTVHSLFPSWALNWPSAHAPHERSVVVVAALAQQVEMLVATPLEMVVKDYE